MTYPNMLRSTTSPIRRLSNMTPNFVRMRDQAKAIQMERAREQTQQRHSSQATDAASVLRQLEALL